MKGTKRINKRHIVFALRQAMLPTVIIGFGFLLMTLVSGAGLTKILILAIVLFILFIGAFAYTLWWTQRSR